MMSDPIPEDHERDLVVQEPEPPRSRLAVFDQAVEKLFALERQRIDSTNRRTDIALKAIEANDAADKRQYDYYVERLHKTAEERSELRRSIFRIVWAVGGVVALVGVLLFLMLFFGTDTQRGMAEGLLRTLLTGLGGAGVFWMLRTLLDRAVRHSRDD